MKDIVDIGTKEVLHKNAIRHTMVWRVTRERTQRIQVGEHVIVDVEGEGRVVMEVTLLFEREDEELGFEGLFCYNHKQLTIVAPFFDVHSKVDAPNGFVANSELVMCSNHYIMEMDDIVEKVYVTEWLYQPLKRTPKGRDKFFYRYVIDVVKQETEPLRSIMN